MLANNKAIQQLERAQPEQAMPRMAISLKVGFYWRPHFHFDLCLVAAAF